MAAAAITLRLATSHDARDLSLMSRDLIETGLGWSYRAERIVRLIEDRETTTLVACEGSHAAGFAVMSFGEERAHLSLLAVRPAYQRQGLGRRMIEWLVESALIAGVAVLSLELRAGNVAARSFYRALGFSETVLVPGYYQGHESAWRMVRVLREPGDLPDARLPNVSKP